MKVRRVLIYLALDFVPMYYLLALPPGSNVNPPFSILGCITKMSQQHGSNYRDDQDQSCNQWLHQTTINAEKQLHLSHRTAPRKRVYLSKIKINQVGSRPIGQIKINAHPFIQLPYIDRPQLLERGTCSKSQSRPNEVDQPYRSRSINGCIQPLPIRFKIRVSLTKTQTPNIEST